MKGKANLRLEESWNRCLLLWAPWLVKGKGLKWSCDHVHRRALQPKFAYDHSRYNCSTFTVLTYTTCMDSGYVHKNLFMYVSFDGNDFRARGASTLVKMEILTSVPAGPIINLITSCRRRRYWKSALCSRDPVYLFSVTTCSLFTFLQKLHNRKTTEEKNEEEGKDLNMLVWYRLTIDLSYDVAPRKPALRRWAERTNKYTNQ